MSWNGTVTCSYCGARGHNRVTCPERKEHVAKAMEIPHEERSWRCRDLLEEDARYKRKSSGPRHCSYCRIRRNTLETGHNRRNCPHAMSDKELLLDMDMQYRPRMLEVLKKHGLGVGAVLEWNKYSALMHGVVTAVHWENISLLNRFRLHRNVPWFTCTDARGKKYDIAMPEFIAEELFVNDSRWRPTIKVFSAAPEAAIAQLMPKKWLSGSTQLVKDFLKANSDDDSYDLQEWIREIRRDGTGFVDDHETILFAGVARSGHHLITLNKKY